MKVNPIINHMNFKKPAFAGYRTHGSINSVDTHGHYPRSEAIENTSGFHSYPTGYVYYADPLEVVRDSVKETVDCVVYDLEPAFPDIENVVSRNYFHGDRSEPDFNRFKSYFYRMEMADRKSVAEYENKYWNNVNPQESREKADYYRSRVSDAQYNQETAANCQNIYNESEPLRNEKVANEIRAYKIDEEKAALEDVLIRSQNELIRKKHLAKALELKISDLKSLKTAYSDLVSKIEESLSNNNTYKAVVQPEKHEDDEYQAFKARNSRNYREREIREEWIRTRGYNAPLVSETDEINEKRLESYLIAHRNFENDSNANLRQKALLQDQVNVLESRIEFYNQELVQCNSVISKLEKSITELPKKIEALIKEKAHVDSEIARIKGELIPFFDKLKNYFHSRGIRVIRG